MDKQVSLHTASTVSMVCLTSCLGHPALYIVTLTEQVARLRHCPLSADGPLVVTLFSPYEPGSPP